MAWLLHGVAGVLQIFLPIYLAGLGGGHHESGADCPYWWLHGLIHPKYVRWGCILAIMQAAPSWWHCPADENQGLSEQSEMWHHSLGSGDYPRKAAWQMALRCFAKSPVEFTCEVSVGEHKRRFGTTMKSSPDMFRTTASLNPICLAPLLEALTK